MLLKINGSENMIGEYDRSLGAGLDLKSTESVTLEPLRVTLVGLGIRTEFSEDYVALLRGRSGLALRGLQVLGGVIDASYRGEWKAILLNTHRVPIEIKAGDRVCQAIFVAVPKLNLTFDENLADSVRGVRGFGSSDQG